MYQCGNCERLDDKLKEAKDEIRTLKELRRKQEKYTKYVNKCKELNEQPLTLEQYKADVIIGAIK